METKAQSTDPVAGRRARRLKYVSRTLLLLVAGFWLFFVVASHWGEGFSKEGLPVLVVATAAIVLLAVVAWFWPWVGGWLLLSVGVLLFVWIAGGSFILGAITLAGPCVLVGAFLLMAASAARAAQTLEAENQDG